MNLPELLHSYPIYVGKSLQKQPENDNPKNGYSTSSSPVKNPHYLIRYDFLPASSNMHDTPALLSVDKSNTTDILIKNDVATGGVRLKGKYDENDKDTECLLVFHGDHFTLEKLEGTFSQLRHVRPVVLKRKRAS